ncbi:MAG: DUF72 domain-containing protein [Longimicrobiales bacterium]
MSAHGQFDLFGARAGVQPAAADANLAALRRLVPERIRLGTSSWSFPGWAGIVYDGPYGEQALARHGLAAYGAHPLLRAVSIDRTYYAPIDETAFADYAAAVPDDFRFLVKADRVLTDPEAEAPDATTGQRDGSRFLDPEHAALAVATPAMRGLREKLGAVVFQFSPRGAGSHGGRVRFAVTLSDFLAALPRGPLYAVELRTPALMTRAYVAALEHAGAAHCYTVHSSMLPLAEQLKRMPARANQKFIVRWMLRAGLDYEGAREQYAPFDRLVEEDVATRETIAQASVECADEDRDVIVCINNKAEGSAPLSAFKLAEAIARKV